MIQIKTWFTGYSSKRVGNNILSGILEPGSNLACFFNEYVFVLVLIAGFGVSLLGVFCPGETVLAVDFTPVMPRRGDTNFVCLSELPSGVEENTIGLGAGMYVSFLELGPAAGDHISMKYDSQREEPTSRFRGSQRVTTRLLPRCR